MSRHMAVCVFICVPASFQISKLATTCADTMHINMWCPACPKDCDKLEQALSKTCTSKHSLAQWACKMPLQKSERHTKCTARGVYEHRHLGESENPGATDATPCGTPEGWITLRCTRLFCRGNRFEEPRRVLRVARNANDGIATRKTIEKP
jgi:hypothetical protein